MSFFKHFTILPGNHFPLTDDSHYSHHVSLTIWCKEKSYIYTENKERTSIQWYGVLFSIKKSYQFCFYARIGLLRTAKYGMTVATLNYLNAQQRAFIIHTFKGHSQLWDHADLDTSFSLWKEFTPTWNQNTSQIPLQSLQCLAWFSIVYWKTCLSEFLLIVCCFYHIWIKTLWILSLWYAN